MVPLEIFLELAPSAARCFLNPPFCLLNGWPGCGRVNSMEFESNKPKHRRDWISYLAYNCFNHKTILKHLKYKMQMYVYN